MDYNFAAQQPAVQSAVTVGASSVEVLSYGGNRARKVFVFTNSSTGAQTITLSFGVPAVAGQGIPLKVGEKYGEAVGDGFDCYQGTINAIADAAGGQISVSARYDI
jgi:hypothetical protein